MYKFLSHTVKLSGLLVACFCWLPVQSQQTKVVNNPLQLADQYFASGEYYTAAYLYEQYLNPSAQNKKEPAFTVYVNRRKPDQKTQHLLRAQVLYKQAASYRLAHYWLQADSAYKKCTSNIDALYWQAVCERSLGRYEEAEESLQRYLNVENTNRLFQEEAEKERQTLLYIRKQLNRADTILTRINKMNITGSYEKGAYAVVPVNDSQYLVSSTQANAAVTSGANPYQSRLWYAALNNDSLGRLTAVALPPAAIIDNQGAASMNSSGNRLYFTQWKKENGHIASAIYCAIKQNNGSWGTPQLLPINSNTYNSKQPFCTADGKYLFFASDRPGGSGGFDIWYAPLNEDGSTGEPVNAGPVINTSGDEQAPFYHSSSSSLVFSTNGRQGMGAFDLFTAKGRETNWSEPVNMGYPVNSSRDDIYFYASEKTGLLTNAVIGSDRGEGCCLETYRIMKTPKSKKLTGVVRDLKSNTPITDADVVLTDPTGKTIVTRTDIDGNYVFDSVDTDRDFTVSISKPTYHDTAAMVKIIRTDETNLLTDRLFNQDMFIKKLLTIKAENVVTVFFDFDKSNLKPEAVKKLDSVYTILITFPAATLQISGYTDGKGTDAYNKILSDKRARACANYFITKGIDAGRISFESFGACCPLEMELINGRDNPDGRSRNRRALINISKE